MPRIHLWQLRTINISRAYINKIGPRNSRIDYSLYFSSVYVSILINLTLFVVYQCILCPPHYTLSRFTNFALLKKVQSTETSKTHTFGLRAGVVKQWLRTGAQCTPVNTLKNSWKLLCEPRGISRKIYRDIFRWYSLVNSGKLNNHFLWDSYEFFWQSSVLHNIHHHSDHSV